MKLQSVRLCSVLQGIVVLFMLIGQCGWGRDPADAELEDNMVRDEVSCSNWCSTGSLTMEYYYYGSLLYDSAVYYKFDLSSVPTDATSARFRFYSSGSSCQHISVTAINSDNKFWDGSSMYYDPSGSEYPCDYLGYFDTDNTVNEIISENITDAVNYITEHYSSYPNNQYITIRVALEPEDNSEYMYIGAKGGDYPAELQLLYD